MKAGFTTRQWEHAEVLFSCFSQGNKQHCHQQRKKRKQNENFEARREYIKHSLPRDFSGGPVVKNLPFNAGDVGSAPGRGTDIPQTAWHGQKTKTKKHLLLWLEKFKKS